MRETANSLVPPGAGRTLDIVNPAPASMVGNSLGIYSRVQYRNPGSVGTLGENTTGTGASFSTTLYMGSQLTLLTNAVATVPGTGVSLFSQQTTWAPNPVLAARTGFLGQAGIARQVTRVWVNAVYFGTPVSDQDYGLELLCAPSIAQPQSIIHGNVPGIGWTHRASGALSVIVNGPNGLFFNDVVTPADYNPALINSYEFQITNPTATADAQLVALLNGIPVFLATWAAGTNLPSYNAAFVQPGMQLINYAGNNLNFGYQSWRFVAAPTLVDSL